MKTGYDKENKFYYIETDKAHAAYWYEPLQRIWKILAHTLEGDEIGEGTTAPTRKDAHAVALQWAQHPQNIPVHHVGESDEGAPQHTL